MKLITRENAKVDIKVYLTTLGHSYYKTANKEAKLASIGSEYGIIYQVNNTDCYIVWYDRFHNPLMDRNNIQIRTAAPYKDNWLAFYDMYDIKVIEKNLDKIAEKL